MGLKCHPENFVTSLPKGHQEKKPVPLSFVMLKLFWLVGIGENYCVKLCLVAIFDFGG